MPRKKKKFILWLFLILLGGVFFFSSRRIFLPPVDYTLLSREIEQTVNRYLSQQGIKKEDILLLARQEKKVGKDTIIEITKEIQLPHKVSLKEYQNSITKVLKDAGVKVYRVGIKENKLCIDSGYRKRILSRLILTLKPKLKIAIVIDDLGYNRKQLDSFLELNIPLTYSILPGEVYSQSLAKELLTKNKEIILHLPLEPKNRKENPGKHALWARMSSNEIIEKFDKNLSTVPGVIGVNNHMGSKFTEDEKKMNTLLNEIKRKELFFFDSHTSKKTKGEKIAKKINLPYLQNQVFLDVRTDRLSIEKKFAELLSLAKENGYAIGIGHIHSKHTPVVLSAFLPRLLNEEEVEFVTLSELLKPLKKSSTVTQKR